MSVKHAMLALLSAQPSSTYQLRKRFDASTGQGLPLNIGQVSTTLQRLERDGLVIRDDGPAGDPTGQPWRLTAAGHEELAGWWASPVVADQRGRDELVMKLMLATIVPGVDIAALIQDQRAATQRGMHDLSRLRRNTLEDDLIGRLIIDRHLFLRRPSCGGSTTSRPPSFVPAGTVAVNQFVTESQDPPRMRQPPSSRLTRPR